jgi:hypothetical protein
MSNDPNERDPCSPHGKSGNSQSIRMNLSRRDFLVTVPAAALAALGAASPARRTTIEIDGDRFLINGRPTYEGRTYRGAKVEGLLMNSRMIQGIFDDSNPATRSLWRYPDTGRWDPERNTREFVAAMPEWRRHGLLSFTINLQGGDPHGYDPNQPWINTAFKPNGTLKHAYLKRLERILDRADELGMAPIVGFFYFGQDQHLRDERAVKRGVEEAGGWLLSKGYRNVLVEINNECDVKDYDHAILKPPRVSELINLAKSLRRRGDSLRVSASFGGGSIPTDNVVAAADFLLMHGNGVSDPARIAAMVREARGRPSYRAMPVLFNEDDHFKFDQPENNMLSAVGAYASWGYFDPGKSNYRDGYQSPPVQWGINTPRKKAFFGLLKEVTGG